MLVIEWNVPMFSQDTSRYPFHPKAAYAPKPAGLSADPPRSSFDEGFVGGFPGKLWGDRSVY
jgi:hypothetical protein